MQKFLFVRNQTDPIRFCRSYASKSKRQNPITPIKLEQLDNWYDDTQKVETRIKLNLILEI